MNYVNIYRHQLFNDDGLAIGKPVLCASDVLNSRIEAEVEAYCDYREEYEVTLAWDEKTTRQIDFRDSGAFDEMDAEAAESAQHEAGLGTPR